jgi:hypothetical protein
VVRRTPRVPPKNPTCARETPYLGRPPLPTPRSGQRRNRQPRPNPPPPRRLHQIIHHRRSQRRVVGTRTTDRDNATEVPRRDCRMDQTPQGNHDPLAQRQQPKTLARTRQNRRPTRRHPEEGNPPPIPRPGNQRTPGTRPHHHNHPPTLLVARHE